MNAVRPDVRTEVRAVMLAAAELPYGGEAVDQLSHALQTATLAVRADESRELVAAALLQDVGRVPEVAASFPNAPHERAGAAWCTWRLGIRVGSLVGTHVLAKRALVTLDPRYAGQLSAVSTASLAEQGGPLTGAELRRFLARPDAADALALRRFDDEAKVPGVVTLALDELLNVVLP